MNAEQLTQRGDTYLGNNEYYAAFEAYTAAASAGYAPAMRKLALLHLDGTRMHRDEAAARKWLSRSTDLGDFEAMFHLGHLLSDTSSFPDRCGYDLVRAFEMYRRAAAGGFADAYWYVAEAYGSAQGVEQDIKLAAHWADLGFAAGDEDCEEQLERFHYEASGGATEALDKVVAKDFDPARLTKLNKLLGSIQRRILAGAGNIDELTSERDAVRKELAELGESDV